MNIDNYCKVLLLVETGQVDSHNYACEILQCCKGCYADGEHAYCEDCYESIIADSD